jgi:hypothetical protein
VDSAAITRIGVTFLSQETLAAWSRRMGSPLVLSFLETTPIYCTRTVFIQTEAFVMAIRLAGINILPSHSQRCYHNFGH